MSDPAIRIFDGTVITIEELCRQLDETLCQRREFRATMLEDFPGYGDIPRLGAWMIRHFLAAGRYWPGAVDLLTKPVMLELARHFGSTRLTARTRQEAADHLWVVLDRHCRG